MKPRVPRGKTMRVATALTGMTACAGAFLPTAAAHAASSAARPGNRKVQTGEGKLVRLKVFPGGITPGGRTVRPDITADPAQPYWLNIYFKGSVTEFEACGWHPNGYACTSPISPFSASGKPFTYEHVGFNKFSWDLGQITIGWNGGGPGHNDTCNTNGAFHGTWELGLSGYESVNLTGANGVPIGNGVPEC